MAKKKFYVVWNGAEPGIYHTWEECRRQVEGIPGAVYKSFSTEEAAEEAFYSSPNLFIGQKNGAAATAPPSAPVSSAPEAQAAAATTAGNTAPAAESAAPTRPAPFVMQPEDAIAVDAACSGNPGQMEYRGVDLLTGQEIFHFGPVYGTNNIGEFLAIVHALALLKKQGKARAVYSDSRNALLWVAKRSCRTTLPNTPETAYLFSLIARAELWLRTNDFSSIPLKKWDTARRGEIPADFGRK